MPTHKCSIMLASLQPEQTIVVNLQKWQNHSVCSYPTVTNLRQFNHSFDMANLY